MSTRLARAAIVIALAALVFWPLAAVIFGLGELGSSERTWSPASGGIERPWSLARNSLALVGLTLAFVMPPGIALGWAIARSDVIGRRAIAAMVRVGLFMPLPLVALAWLGAFGNLGRAQALGPSPFLVRLPGAAFVHAVAALPWVAIVVGQGLRQVEPDQESAARLDQAAWRVAISYTLRRSWGAIAAAAVIVGVSTAGEMTVTDLLQVHTYAEEAYLQAQLGGVPAIIAAPQLAVVFIVNLSLWSVVSWREPPSQGESRWRAGIWRLGRARPIASSAIWVGFALFCGLPLYALVWRAGRVGGGPGRPPHWSLAGLWGTLERSFASVAEPLADTVCWIVLGAAGATLIALGLAWFARTSALWRLIAVLAATIAFATPGPVAGSALKLAYNPALPHAEDSWWVHALCHSLYAIHDGPWLLAFGYAARGFPFALALLWPAARRVPRESLEAAAIDGMGPARRFWVAAVPALWPTIVASFTVAFALSLGELAVAYVVAPPGTTPLSVVLWGLLHTGVESHVAGVGMIVLGVVLLAGSLAGYLLSLAFRFDTV